MNFQGEDAYMPVRNVSGDIRYVVARDVPEPRSILS